MKTYTIEEINNKAKLHNFCFELKSLNNNLSGIFCEKIPDKFIGEVTNEKITLCFSKDEWPELELKTLFSFCQCSIIIESNNSRAMILNSKLDYEFTGDAMIFKSPVKIELPVIKNNGTIQFCFAELLKEE